MSAVWQRPVMVGVITARFGESGPRWTSRHTGLDFAAPAGTPILAAGPGTVRQASWANGAYGNMVVIDHGAGIETWYAHMSRTAVTVGQTVRRGQTIGYVGKTGNASGNHVHLEFRIDGRAVDPEEFLGKSIQTGGAPVGSSSSILSGAGIDVAGGFGRAGLFLGGAFVLGIAVFLLAKNRGLL